MTQVLENVNFETGLLQLTAGLQIEYIRGVTHGTPGTVSDLVTCQGRQKPLWIQLVEFGDIDADNVRNADPPIFPIEKFRINSTSGQFQFRSICRQASVRYLACVVYGPQGLPMPEV